MTSLRHTPAGETSPPPARDGYLDAARDCILDLGWRRTTLTEVARRAGVSRMTIYRTWADMPTLLGDLMTREWEAVVSRTMPAGDIPTSHELAAAAVTVVRALRENELFRRIVEIDPELLLPYLIERRGRSQQLLVDLLTEAITTGQASGQVREGDAVTIARTLVLAAHGFVISTTTMVDDEVTLGALDAELQRLLERSLEP